MTRMRYLKTHTLYCFSPPVMIITFVIEIGCLIYTLWRYKFNAISRISSLILLCLAIFQLAEYNVCEGSFGISSLSWARLGYAAITLLPPLGIHLATHLADDAKSKWLVYGSYGSGLVFAAFFLLVDHGIESQQCLGNYVIFNIAPTASVLYAAYYYILLGVAVLYSWVSASGSSSPDRAHALQFLSIGYMAFIIPTIAAVIINPTAVLGIPSIMCGFAVILALLISFFVLPRYFKSKIQ